MRVLVPHGIAVAALLGLAWFILQPIQGDIAFWTPAFASLLVAGCTFILAGCFAWWRFGSRGALVAGDVAALVPMAYVSLVLLFLPVTLIAAAMLLVGAVAAGRDDATRERSAQGTASVHPVALLAAVVVAGLIALSALDAVLGDVAPFLDYGLSEVLVAGVYGLSILFWLDGRPGVLLGGSIALLYFSVRRFANVDTIAITGPEHLVYGLVLLVAGVVVAAATARSVRSRPPTGQLASIAVAAITVAAVVIQQLAAPLALVAGLTIERSSPRPTTLPPSTVGQT